MPGDPNSGPITYLLVAAAVATVVGLVRSWRAFWDDDFTSADQRRALQLAVFVVPAVVVLFHELGHVAAAWAVGAEVVDFHYGFFEGSVTVAGNLSPAANWLVAVSGSLLSVAIGLAMVVWGSRRRGSTAARYLALTAGLLGLVFALVGYPFISFTTGFGDWVAVYDFAATPALSAATAAVHLAGLGALVAWWRSTGRLLLLTIRRDAAERLAAARAEVAARPLDTVPRLELTQVYLDLGSPALARQVLDQAADEGVDPLRINLARTRLALSTRRWSEAVAAATRGLEEAASNGATPGGEAAEQIGRMRANLVVALARMERWDMTLAALEQLDSGWRDDPRLGYCRARALIGTGDVGAGRALLGEIARSVPADDLLGRWADARLRGTVPDLDEQSHLPASQRARQPPPEPLGRF